VVMTHHAWTACVFADEEANITRVLVND
jgi:hypothetical protein